MKWLLFYIVILKIRISVDYEIISDRFIQHALY